MISLERHSYGKPKYFSRLFKERFGKSPSEYL
ncbi:MAG: AraC family transcriptional regulator [Saprospiraceae bacterium]|nr:AraC family transcriptional regulator [Saprospiraceae bacterium]